MTTRLLRSAAILAIIVPGPLLATVYQIEFAGTFTWCGNCIGSAFEPLLGTAFHGKVVFNDESADQDPDPNFARYFNPYALFTMELDTAVDEFDLDTEGHPLFVDNDRHRGPPDELVEFEYLDSVSMGPLGDYLFLLGLYSGSNDSAIVGAFDSDAIPSAETMQSLTHGVFEIVAVGANIVALDLIYTVTEVPPKVSVPAVSPVLLVLAAMCVVSVCTVAGNVKKSACADRTPRKWADADHCDGYLERE